jgi:hypothetical protein
MIPRRRAALKMGFTGARSKPDLAKGSVLAIRRRFGLIDRGDVGPTRPARPSHGVIA